MDVLLWEERLVQWEMGFNIIATLWSEPKDRAAALVAFRAAFKGVKTKKTHTLMLSRRRRRRLRFLTSSLTHSLTHLLIHLLINSFFLSLAQLITLPFIF